VGSGAWPFLVGGLICLVNSENERDLNLLIGVAKLVILTKRFCYRAWINLLKGLFVFQ
jgi:hypothetical protein